MMRKLLRLSCFKKKSSFLTPSFLHFIFLISCSIPLRYQPAMLDLDRTYMPKPMMTDSFKSVYALSASQINSHYNKADIQELCEINLSAAHRLGWLQLSYGTYLFWGKYTNGSIKSDADYYFERKKLNGYGFRASLNYVHTDGQFEFRFPGIECSFSEEKGAFAAFRKSLLYQDQYYSNPRTGLFTLGISNEAAWKHSRYPSFQFAFKVFVGRYFGDMSYYNSKSWTEGPQEVQSRMTFDASLMVAMRQFYLVGSLSRISHFKLSLGYALGKRSPKPKTYEKQPPVH